MTAKSKLLLLKVIIHLSALVPLVNCYFLAFTDQLGSDPVEAVIHFTGIGAFNLLLLTLAISPLAQGFKIVYLIRTRRLLGLYCFTYALFHLLNFIAFELQFDWRLLISEIFERPYISVGAAALFILTELAITSLDKVKRQMGKSWQRLHNYIYLAVLLVAVHFYWSVKSDIIEPSIYIAITIFLLSFRLSKLRRWLKNR